MSILRNLALAATSTAFLGAGAAVAQDNFRFPLKARQGVMATMAVNLGMLGAMAKGEMDYDADLAQLAADNIVAISNLNLAPLLPAGSDSDSIEGTRAKPSVWADNADFLAEWENLGNQAMAMQQVAANGAEALGPAMGGLGKACQSCHESHQVPRN